MVDVIKSERVKVQSGKDRIDYTLQLSSGRTIELTEAELQELGDFNEKMLVEKIVRMMLANPESYDLIEVDDEVRSNPAFINLCVTAYQAGEESARQIDDFAIACNREIAETMNGTIKAYQRYKEFIHV